MVVLPDSSVWIDVLHARRTSRTDALFRAAERDRVVVGDLVLAEVLQGIRDDRQFEATRARLALFQIVSLSAPTIAVRAAENFRLLRRHGVTVRGAIDVVIATWCIENDASIIHNDRDPRAMEEHLGLRAY